VRKRENRGGGVVYFNKGEFGGQMSRITGDLELGGNDVCPLPRRATGRRFSPLKTTEFE